MTSAHTDDRAIARAWLSVNTARDDVAAASSAIRAASDSPIADVPGALEVAQTRLQNAWDALGYVAGELGAAIGAPQ